jgi:hypothetical protein
MDDASQSKLICRDLEPISKAEFDHAMANGTAEKRRAAAFRAADSIDDYEWLVERLKRILDSDSVEVRSAALIGIGYVARRFRQADERELIKIIRPYLKNADLADDAEYAKWDIYVFLSKHRRKRKRERRKALENKA